VSLTSVRSVHEHVPTRTRLAPISMAGASSRGPSAVRRRGMSRTLPATVPKWGRARNRTRPQGSALPGHRCPATGLGNALLLWVAESLAEHLGGGPGRRPAPPFAAERGGAGRRKEGVVRLDAPAASSPMGGAPSRLTADGRGLPAC